MCVIGKKEVGIDIEKVKSVEIDVAMRFFSDKECEYLVSRQENLLNTFYDLWTLKESYIKKVGKGLSMSLNSFSIEYVENDIAIIPTPDEKIYFRELFIDDNYKLHICTEESVILQSINIVEINEIVRSEFFEH